MPPAVDVERAGEALAMRALESADRRAASSVAPPLIRRRPPPARPTLARYAVQGRPLCQIEDALRFGEILRRAVMGRARRTLGEDRIPPMLSGHGTHDHGHAFYLPEAHDAAQATPAGRIHHAMVYAHAGFDRGTVDVLDRLGQVVVGEGRSWQLVLEGIGDRNAFRSPLLETATDWISVTPYLHPWHRKPRFDVPDQIRRECRERGLPEPASLDHVAEISVGGRARRPIDFHRFRSKRGLAQPDRHGSFWRVHFAEPVAGPVALGFGCHFGLGLFAPAQGHRPGG